jgi:PAS domain S-box-containing protein
MGPNALGARGWGWTRLALSAAVVVALLCLAAANLALHSWSEVEDGVFWAVEQEDIVARHVAPDSPAAAVGLQPGDVLLAIDGRPVVALDDVLTAIHASEAGTPLQYMIERAAASDWLTVTLSPVRSTSELYFLLAAVGIFTLLVGAWVRLRRPMDQATLHFFWLTVAFFGVMAFSFSGRLDTLDYVFYWSDVVAMLMLPPLFLHFALVFPERPQAWVKTEGGRAFVRVLYVTALLMGAAQVAVFAQGLPGSALFSTVVNRLEELQHVYLAVCLVAGLWVMVRALRRVRSVTARRQLRWIVWGTAIGALPFSLGYVAPWVSGFTPPRLVEYTALLLGLVPLAFASAIVRYRLMDVEVIIKRALAYTAAVAAILVIYAVLLRVAGAVFLREGDRSNTVIAMLATLVVVLLAGPVKNAIQTALDRVYYRDRYDYRRALVAFARELNSDLDLFRLSERLVTRVVETLVVDRMALLLAPLEARGGEFTAIASAGFEAGPPPRLARGSALAQRLLGGHTVAIDDPVSARRLSPEEIAFWRDAGIHYFIPCVSKEGTIAVMALGRKASAEPLSSEDMALLLAVAAQAATALENGRLYRELRVKADELDRMREFSENILESLNDGLAVLDLHDRVVRWNRRLAELYGVARTAAVGRPVDEVFDKDFVERLRAARAESPDGATLYRVPLVTGHEPQRQRLLVNAAFAPLRTPGGDISGAIVIVEDISSRVQLEEQLQISEKMASIGLLAAGVAHEVNTPLTGISSFTQMLLERADPDDPATKVLEKIERQTFRAARIVNGLLNLARPAQVESGPVDLNAVINDVLALLDHQLRTAHIQVRKDLSSDPPIVLGIEHKLQQVFLNLFLNARDAMPKGGWLSVTTRTAGAAADIEVGDTGTGIPSEHMSRIYDPFFTTKAIGKGTGLGLSITYGIVQEHAGTIACESAVGKGTRFRLTLPAAGAAVAGQRGGGTQA